MTSERWQEVKLLFESSLLKDPGQRASFLDEACAGDPSLRREVESLLASHAQAGSFIEPAAGATVSMALGREGPPAAERRIGPYKLIREIGEGGMGTVYLALRADDQYRKRVAVKLVKAGMDKEVILQRFRNERQILASLDHPHIARLLDGGTTEEGLPYFVMEYIEGTVIYDYCDSHKLSTVERLKLFRTVCSAVHYAHQNLVVHRDIKPGNILVTVAGEPKLLDFGIAKLLNPELSSQPIDPTATALRVMTPQYASPEQIRGEKITIATDVYSLGVLLYELLTGHGPYRLKSTLPHELARAICDEEPDKPSTAVNRVEEVPGSGGTPWITVTPEMVSKTREGLPEKLRRRLGGDLDNIVLMALRKEPQRRYASVEHFAEDIRRHLEGLPVIARKDTLGYRTGKFVMRNKAGVLAAAMILLALLGGIIGTAWQARVARAERARAEQRFNDVRQLANSVVFELHDAIALLPGATPARQLLVTRALRYLDSLAKESGKDPSLQRELAMAYQKLGDIQGNPAVPNLGNTSGALESYRKAMAIHEALAAAEPQSVQARLDLASSYGRIGYLMDEPSKSMANFRKALALREALLAEDPTNPKLQSDLGASFDQMGGALWAAGDFTGMLEYRRKGLSIFQKLAAADPANGVAQRNLALAHKKLGAILGKTGALSEGLENYRKALEIDEALAAADPNNAQARIDASFDYSDIGWIMIEKGDLAAALENYQKALALRKALAAADPADVRASGSLATTYTRIGYILAQRKDPAGALENYRAALALRDSLSIRNPKGSTDRHELAELHCRVGGAHASLAADRQAPVRKQIESWRAARSSYQQALEIYRDLRSRGILSKNETARPDEVAREIAKCDTSLAKLQGSSASKIR